MFEIQDNMLKANEVFDFEAKNTYAIRVRSTDQGGLFTEQSFTIHIPDVVEDSTAPTSEFAACQCDVTLDSNFGDWK